MARKTLPSAQLPDWNAVDDALRQIAVLNRDTAIIDHALNAEIELAKQRAKQDRAPLISERERLELLLQQFCESHRADFGKFRSKKLNFGTVGFRVTSKIVIRKVADTLAALHEFGLHGCIRTKEEPDKEAMKNLSTDLLTAVGATLKVDDTFGYEIHQIDLAEANLS